MKLFFQDLEYNHLLYNTFGPLTCSIKRTQCIKLQTNNGTGKTVLLKTITGMLLPKKGMIIDSVRNHQMKYMQNNRLSNSQYKKYKLIYNLANKCYLWILDEPYSFLDITSIIYYKKKIVSHVNHGGSVLFTDCVKKTMLPCIIYYNSLQWI
jgi:ABC-type transport system involved in cytochrome c biogenesis ATPase subunit